MNSENKKSDEQEKEESVTSSGMDFRLRFWLAFFAFLIVGVIVAIVVLTSASQTADSITRIATMGFISIVFVFLEAIYPTRAIKTGNKSTFTMDNPIIHFVIYLLLSIVTNYLLPRVR